MSSESGLSLSESSDSELDDAPSSAPKVDARIPSNRQKLNVRGKNPPFIDMIVEAVEDAAEGRKGASVPAIKASMRAKHNILDVSMKTHFKKQLSKAIENGTLIRPQQYKESKGLAGRFKVNPGHIKAKLKGEGTTKKSRVPAVNNPLTTKKKRTAARKSIKRRPRVSDVNTNKLMSLKQTSAATKVAKERIKKARKSLGLSNALKPKVVTKKKVTSSAKKATSKNTDEVVKKPKSAGKKTIKVVTRAPNDGKASKSPKPKPKKTLQKKKLVKEK